MRNLSIRASTLFLSFFKSRVFNLSIPIKPSLSLFFFFKPKQSPLLKCSRLLSHNDVLSSDRENI